jgi:NADPH2 dehydrogenase
MKTSLLNRYSGLTFKNGQVLSNRVVVPPMASETGDTAGFVTEKTVQHYSRLASSGAGLVMVEYTYIHASGRSEEFQLGLVSDEHRDGLKKLANVIHAQGAMAGLQLTHSGGKTERRYSNGFLQGPSAVRVPVKDMELEIPQEMNQAEIQLWTHSFYAAVNRAVEAGFDLIELHAAHGYGLNQWLSPLTNIRQDEYGGSLANNSKILFEIIDGLRSQHPHVLFSVRMPGQDFISGGLTHEDTQYIALELQKRGVDLLNISSGIGGWRRPAARIGEGYLVDEAIQIQSKLSIPVIGVGGIESGDYIDSVISTNKISLAAVGRAILKDPAVWGEKNLKEGSYV